MNYKPKKRKQPKPTTQDFIFRFFQNQTQYICKITVSISVPKYRVKEIFDREFVGKKFMPSHNPFFSIDTHAFYVVQTVKEYEECQMQK